MFPGVASLVVTRSGLEPLSSLDLLYRNGDFLSRKLFDDEVFLIIYFEEPLPFKIYLRPTPCVDYLRDPLIGFSIMLMLISSL